MPTALIAEDESLLAEALVHELRSLWPQLQVLAVAGDGLSAVELALQHRPDVLFFDIRLPGQSGLEAAAELLDAWPTGPGTGSVSGAGHTGQVGKSGQMGQSGQVSEPPFPLLVFVTAYDEYAMAAFEAQALDYVLKPVRADRLTRTVRRLQNTLAQRAAQSPAAFAPGDAPASTVQAEPGDALQPVMAQLRALLSPPPEPTLPRLRLLQAGVGQQLRMVPIEQVLLLEAADKYVRAVCQDGQEHWLRTPLRELLQRLDPEEFWQIHRGTVVRASAIASASRDEQGRWRVQLQAGLPSYTVSRLFAHRFRAM